jgi:hypothetical protein
VVIILTELRRILRLSEDYWTSGTAYVIVLSDMVVSSRD